MIMLKSAQPAFYLSIFELWMAENKQLLGVCRQSTVEAARERVIVKLDSSGRVNVQSTRSDPCRPQPESFSLRRAEFGY